MIPVISAPVFVFLENLNIVKLSNLICPPPSFIPKLGLWGLLDILVIRPSSDASNGGDVSLGGQQNCLSSVKSPLLDIYVNCESFGIGAKYY